MAQWYRAQAIIPHTSGLPEDSVVNTWHYMVDGSGDRAVIASSFNVQLDAFYTALLTYLSDAYTWNGFPVKHYDFLDSKPRRPFLETQVTTGPTGTSLTQFPAEVSLCLSMQATAASGENQARMRGRIYLGPFQLTAGDMPLAPSAMADVVATAANTAFLAGAPSTKLAVYSPYTHHGIPVGERLTEDSEEVPDALPSSFHAVTKVWCDNAWDTQRRRGLKATYRKSFGA